MNKLLSKPHIMHATQNSLLRQLCLVMAFLLVSNVVFSQAYNPKCRYSGLGVSVKTAYFMGDIPSDWTFLRPGFGISYTKRFHPRWSMVTEVSMVRLMGDDASISNPTNPQQQFSYLRNLHFRNDIKSVDVFFQYDLFPSIDHYRKRPLYNIYGLMGAGFMVHNPKAKDTTGHWTALRPLKTEGVSYSQYQVSVPLGVGVRYKLAIQWDLEFEFAYKFTFTDRLDDVSGGYADPSTLSGDGIYLSNPSGNPNGSLTGDPRNMTGMEDVNLNNTYPGTPGYTYADGHGPGDRRGSRTGFDAFAVFSIRLIWVIPQEKLMCPRY